MGIKNNLCSNENKNSEHNNKAEQTNPEAEKILDKARASIGTYCYKECHAFCCRKGYLPVDDKAVNLLLGSIKDEYEKAGALKKVKGHYAIYLNYRDGCPKLSKDFKCTVHNHPHRPAACRIFPIDLVDNKFIKLSSRCPAVKENLLYPYIAQLVLLGYKVVDYDFFTSIEFYDFDFN